MPGKKIILLIAVFFIFFIGLIWFANQKPNITSSIVLSSESEHASDKIGYKNFLETGFWDYKKIIDQYFLESPLGELFQEKNIYAAVTSHHFPLAASFIADLYNVLKNSHGLRQTFVIIGPDHFERCGSLATLSDWPIFAPSGKLEPDKSIIESLVAVGAKINNDCFQGEHAILTQAIFLAYLFPAAKIVPLLFSSRTPDDLIIEIAESLAKSNADIFLLGSVDFSHYRSYNEARSLDEDSREMIMSMDLSAATLEHMDSPASIKLINYYAKKKGLEPEIIDNANSYDFTGYPANTTSYFDIIYYSNLKNRPETGL
jgi:AmmeMemoRadiSam system protein B